MSWRRVWLFFHQPAVSQFDAYCNLSYRLLDASSASREELFKIIEDIIELPKLILVDRAQEEGREGLRLLDPCRIGF